jgi:hypothetical protein
MVQSRRPCRIPCLRDVYRPRRRAPGIHIARVRGDNPMGRPGRAFFSTVEYISASVLDNAAGSDG